jgi:hypothetical protein
LFDDHPCAYDFSNFPAMLRAITLFAATAATTLVCGRADACLWETKAELDARYGKPIRTFDNEYGKNYIYRFKQFEVQVVLFDGKSQSEVYRHSNDNSDLTLKEWETLLSLNQLGNGWRATEEKGMFALVKPSGGDPIAVALWGLKSQPMGILMVVTADFAKKAGLPPVVRLPDTEQASPAR